MEAAITTDDDLDATLRNILQDERKVRAVLARAEGKSWKEVAAAAGVDRVQIWKWRHMCPFDQLVAKLVLDGVKSAVVRITAQAEDAADVISSHLKGEFGIATKDENGDPILIADYDAERLRSAAAKTVLGTALKLVEAAAEHERKQPMRPALPAQSGAQPLPTPEGAQAAERLRRKR
jgi:hypothetical protein